MIYSLHNSFAKSHEQYITKKEKKKVEEKVVEHQEHFSILPVLDLSGWKAQKVSRAYRACRE